MAFEQPKVYKDTNGDNLTVASGGTLTLAGTQTVSSGGALTAASGSTVTLAGTTVVTGTVTPVHAAGTAAGSGITASESGDAVNVTTITLASKAVTMTDATTNGCHGSTLLYTFAAEGVSILKAESNLTFTAGSGGIADGAALVYGVGSATIGTNNATITSTEGDVIPSTAATLTSGTVSNVKGCVSAPLTLNGQASAKSMYLNLAVPDADSSGNDTITVSGTVTIKWV